jgi:glycosyltransferase involved in cell wall biosynthesis
MKIALFGNFMYELAIGLRENPENDVRLFLDSRTIPTCLRGEPMLDDPTFAVVAPWVGRKEILRPGDAEITERLSDFDVAIVTDLGPIFAECSATPFVFVPGGWDLTHIPFPVRSRSTRRRGRADVVEAAIAVRQRRGIRGAASIWAPAFTPYRRAVNRLGLELGGCLPQAIDTGLFSPRQPLRRSTSDGSPLTIFHPTRFMFTPDPFLIETGGWKRNDLLLRGFALAIARGLDGRLVLIEREGSPDEWRARDLIDDLGIGSRVDWLGTGSGVEFTWREVAALYRSYDVSSDDFGGWFGLAALEGASSGLPVLNHLESDVMAVEYPDGHPFVQVADADQICAAILELNDPDHRLEIGQASREWVMEHHDRSVVARRCEHMLADAGLA